MLSCRLEFPSFVFFCLVSSGFPSCCGEEFSFDSEGPKLFLGESVESSSHTYLRNPGVATPLISNLTLNQLNRWKVETYCATHFNRRKGCHSLVQHLLSWFFEFTSSLYVKLLVFLGYCGGGTPVCSILSNYINSLIVVIRLVGICCIGQSTLLSRKALILHLLVLHLLQALSVLSIWNLWNLTTRNGRFFIIRRLSLFANNVQNWVFQGFFIFAESVLLPGVVHSLGVILVSSHAVHKHSDTSAVVRLLFEFKRTAVVHEFFEFVRMAAT